jgi:glutamate 5-kinase
MQKIRRVVIKVGTKVLTSADRSIDRDAMRSLANQISDVQDAGIKTLLVTSGAIGSGMWLLGLKKRPSGKIAQLQASAAIGQGHLMHLYGDIFRSRGYNVGQMLLTQEDFNDRARYLNIKHTIDALLEHNAIPVINENDTVATDEIRCGDNDRLSGLVADLAGADMLILLSDVDGFLDRDGKVIRRVSALTPYLAGHAGKSRCDLGTGGMATKIEAASIAAKSGITCVIANGRDKNVIRRVIDGEDIGTVFTTAAARKVDAKKRWIAFSSRSKGEIVVDGGAGRALKDRHKSLLASGILEVRGSFESGGAVSILDSEGREIARGLSEYSSSDIAKIKGLKTSDFKRVLGYKTSDEVVHKDNLVIL